VQFQIKANQHPNAQRQKINGMRFIDLNYVEKGLNKEGVLIYICGAVSA
jgi:hypothetical protein